MAVTVDDVADMLEEAGVRFEDRLDGSLGIEWPTERFLDRRGRFCLTVVVRLLEEGRYVTIYAPEAFIVREATLGPLLKACTMIQWKTKLVQFEYDEVEGELRPMIEFPLEDSTLTAQQLLHCVAGLGRLVDRYHPVISRALHDGVVFFPEDEEDRVVSGLSSLLGRLQRSTADRVARFRQLERELQELESEGDPRSESRIELVRTVIAEMEEELSSMVGPTEL